MIFKEIASGAKQERPELANLLNHIHKGDVIVVYKLDRLGRSLKHLYNLFNEKEVGLQSISDAIDTTTSQRKIVF